MSKKKKTLYCWDTSTLLAWLKDEASAPIADMALVVSEIDSKTANLLLPATVYSEVFMTTLDEEQKSRLQGFLNRSNVLSVDLTIPIATRAAAIREDGSRETPKRKIKTADAQIAATAVMHSADFLHSLDSDLLSLDGHPTVDGIRICRPRPASGQMGIFN